MVIVLIAPTLGFGGWKQVGNFNRAVSCGFFFNEKNGLIGFGTTTTDDKKQITIKRTTDGGLTWLASTVPAGAGRVSSIFMKDTLIGYASIMYASYSILKTNDGGKTWQNMINGDNESSTCVHATSKAVIRTLWYAVGGATTNKGLTFSQVFTGGNEDRSNGIAFLDDLNGVVTMGPDVSFFGNGQPRTYYTADGGVTWRQGGNMRESWGVYADRTTRTYVSLAEDYQRTAGDALYKSIDNGRSWQQSNPSLLNNYEFTGHIAGVASTIYVQTEVATNRGMYRSDDLGNTWRAVDGPSNTRDSRFCVLGCRGEIVYAFDDNGAVWKTTDGGDGSIIPPPYIGKIESKGVGEKLLIPIIYDSLPVPIPLQEIAGTISLNDDLLQPDSIFLTMSQLESLATFDTIFQISKGIWSFDIKLKKTATISGSSVKPLFLVFAHTYLSDSLSTPVTIQTVNFVNNGNSSLLGTCSAFASNFDFGEFVLKTECGDSTLIKALRRENLSSLFAVRPNPAYGVVTISSQMPSASEVVADLINSAGQNVAHQVLHTSLGYSEHKFSTEGIPSGIYILSLKTNYGTVHHLNIVIDH